MDEQRVNALSNQQAVAAVNKVVDAWVRKNGARALHEVGNLRITAQEQKIAVPSSLVLADIGKTTDEQGNTARGLLSGFLESDDAQIRTWADEAVSEFSGSSAQVDPVFTLQKLGKGDIAAIAVLAAALFGMS
jgi:hypothetical protein